MESADQNEQLFCSVYTHGVDEKRRVQIPAKWRPKQEGSELYLVLWLKYKEGACIRGFTPSKYRHLLNTLDARPNEDPMKPVLKRLIGSYSESTTIDKAGRICIPENLAKQAAITNTAVLTGMGRHFEIWCPERHRLIEASDAFFAPDAFRVME